MFKSLSGRFLVLTVIFVMLAEVLIFLPSIARFRVDYLQTRLERAQIASLVLLATDMIDPKLEAELLQNAHVFNVVLRRDEMRELVLSSPMPQMVSANYDLRRAGAWSLMRDALLQIVDAAPRTIRVIGTPSQMGGELIEVTMASAPLRTAMLDYGLRILWLSLVISAVTAGLLFFAVQKLLVRPITRVVGHMQNYAAAPEDARNIITPRTQIRELRAAEDSLHSLQTQLSALLRQKDRLAQLGAAVAKVSHDLRNILTTAQLFSDRLDASTDPSVARMAPKLVAAITRAVSLTETTLAFGRAEEPAPSLQRIVLAPLVADVIESELLAGDQNITFTPQISDNFVLRADPEQLHRMMTNMLRNARQALQMQSQGGDVTIQAHDDAHNWFITITDTGPGIPPKARAYLFQPFQGSTKKSGSGLGLAIVAELMRGHGGAITLDRSDDTGTAFTLSFPKGDISGTQARSF